VIFHQDYDVERDKFGRIVTASNNNQGGNVRRDESRGGASNRDRSRDRDNRIERNDWTDGRRGGDQQASNNATGGNWKYGSTYGLSSTFLESLGIDGPLIPRVFISNVGFLGFKILFIVISVKLPLTLHSLTSVLMKRSSKKCFDSLEEF